MKMEEDIVTNMEKNTVTMTGEDIAMKMKNIAMEDTVMNMEEDTVTMMGEDTVMMMEEDNTIVYKK
jgi:hypothetical protein